MRQKFWKTSGIAALAILMMAVTAQISVNAQDAGGKENVDERKSNDFGNTRRLEGVWRVTLTPRNCVTGVPIPTAAGEALLTFHKGGTLSAWFQNSTITITRSPSHGIWRPDGSTIYGLPNYSFKFVHLRYNLTTGAFIGRQEAGGTLELSANGDEFTTDSQTTVFNLDGTTVVGCSNAVGTRFE